MTTASPFFDAGVLSPVRPDEKTLRAVLYENERALKEVARRRKIKEAHDRLLSFVELNFPDTKEPDNALKTRYLAEEFHKSIIKVFEDIEAGKHRKVILCMPPRHGKTEIASRNFPAWFVGRDPYRHVMVASYNQPFVEEHGKAVREIMQSSTFREVFPDCQLRSGSQATDRLQTEAGGVLAFVGRGGSITGRGAHLFIIDDPLKNSKEADSQLIRDECWTWFNNDVMSRMMTDEAAIVIISTRWHEDDIVGRLTDPMNPNYNAEEAVEWRIINIRALAEDDDVMGRPLGAALWPSRFGVKWLLGQKRRDARGFTALYQQRPTPEDGDFFQSSMIKDYLPHEKPDKANLRIYAASDHAVGQKQVNDRTCMVVVGVDLEGVIWLLDIVWERLDTKKAVDEMMRLMKKWRPSVWWSEKDHISKSLGPFLKKRMREEHVFIHVQEITSHRSDKTQKARSIQGRMSMGMVRLPKQHPLYMQMVDELLKFPHGRFDDFVDVISVIGRGLNKMFGPSKEQPKQSEVKVGTLRWIKQAGDKERAARQRAALMRGM